MHNSRLSTAERRVINYSCPLLCGLVIYCSKCCLYKDVIENLVLALVLPTVSGARCTSCNWFVNWR